MQTKHGSTPVARQVPFDNSTNGFTAINTQSAIEEIQASAIVSASVTFTWGRSGVTVSGTWLLNESVPSNKAGRANVLNATQVVKFFSASEDLDTYTLELYEHEGDEIGLTLIHTLTVTASRTGNSGTISAAITSGKQLAIKLATGTARNIVCGIIPKGNT